MGNSQKTSTDITEEQLAKALFVQDKMGMLLVAFGIKYPNEDDDTILIMLAYCSMWVGISSAIGAMRDEDYGDRLKDVGSMIENSFAEGWRQATTKPDDIAIN